MAYLSASAELQSDHWRPGMPSTGYPVAMCRIASCRDNMMLHYVSDKSDPTCKGPVSDLAGIPDFKSPRLIIWFQPRCVACQNSEEKVFPALIDAATARGFTVHKQEATPEMVKRFPHVLMVPMYDVVTPSPSEGDCSVYGPNTVLRTLRNDLRSLRDVFPNFNIAR